MRAQPAPQRGPCRDGVNCLIDGCKFAHPEGQLRIIPGYKGPCRNGLECENPTCMFGHPPGRDIDALEVQRCAKSIFVGSLPTRTTPKDLEEGFRCFGPIEYSDIPKKKGTGESRCFGHVQFYEQDSVQAALEWQATREPWDTAWKVQPRIYQYAGGHFKSLDRTQRIYVAGEKVELRPDQIKFTHGYLSFCFKDGKTIDETIDNIYREDVANCFEDAPPMHVVRKDGDYYSLSNPRLSASKILAKQPGFRFGRNRDKDTVTVLVFSLDHPLVDAQYNLSIATQVHGGDFVLPKQCGVCGRRHDSRFLQDHVADEHLEDWMAEMDKVYAAWRPAGFEVLEP